MQIYRKTRRGIGGILAKQAFKILIWFILFMIINFLISRLDLPAPSKNIEQKIPNENFKVIK